MNVASVRRTLRIKFDIVSPQAFAYSLIASSSFLSIFAEIVGMDHGRSSSIDIDTSKFESLWIQTLAGLNCRALNCRALN